MSHALVPQPDFRNHPLKMGGRFITVVDDERQALPDPAHCAPDVTRKAILDGLGLQRAIKKGAASRVRHLRSHVTCMR